MKIVKKDRTHSKLIIQWKIWIQKKGSPDKLETSFCCSIIYKKKTFLQYTLEIRKLSNFTNILKKCLLGIGGK